MQSNTSSITSSNFNTNSDYYLKVKKDNSGSLLYLLLIFLLGGNISLSADLLEYLTLLAKDLLTIFDKDLKIEVKPLLKELSNNPDIIKKLLHQISLGKTQLDQFITLTINSYTDNKRLLVLDFDTNGISLREKLEGFDLNSKDLSYSSFIYTMFIRGLNKNLNLPPLTISRLEILINNLNVWKGKVKVLPEFSRILFIEENSNDINKFTIKTLTQCLTFKIKVDPYIIGENSIAKITNDIVGVSFTKIIDLNRDNTINTSFALDINYESDKVKLNLNPKTGTFGTIIDWDNSLYNSTLDLFQEITRIIAIAL